MVAVDPALASAFVLGAVALYTLVTAAGRALDALLALARRFGLSEALVGLTIVAVGTGLPEIGAHVTASAGIVSGVLDYRVTSAVVLGGNMGSSATQQFLLFGILLLGYGPVDLSTRALVDTFAPMIAALALTLLVAWDGTVSRLDGAVLLAAYAAYLAYSYVRHRGAAPAGEPSANVPRDALVASAMLLLVLASASILLAVVDDVVESVLLGGSMVGVLTLGIAASFPELSTVLDAIRRRAPHVAIGTLVGSTVVNPLVGIGLGGTISTYAVPSAVLVWDLPFKIAVTIGLAAHLYRRDGLLTRRTGVSLVVPYFVYAVGRLLLFPGQ